MTDPFASPGDNLDVRYRSAEQIRTGGALANLGSGPQITTHGTPANLIYRYDLAEEAFLCHSGSAEVWLRGQWVGLEPGDLAYVPEGCERAVRNTGTEPAVLVVQITPPQIDLYADHGFYNAELAVFDHEAAAKARTTAPEVELPEAQFAYRETQAELRAWNLERDDVRRNGALFNVFMGAEFFGIGLPMRLILWPGAGTRCVGFNYAYDPDGVTDLLHTHAVSERMPDHVDGSGPLLHRRAVGRRPRQRRCAGAVRVAHGHVSDGGSTYFGGFASPPQLDLVIPTEFYDDGVFTAPASTRLQVD